MRRTALLLSLGVALAIVHPASAADHGGPVPWVDECADMHYGTCESYDGTWCGAFVGVWVDTYNEGVCLPPAPA